MRISGIEPSSVILSKTKKFNILEVMPKIAQTKKCKTLQYDAQQMS